MTKQEITEKQLLEKPCGGCWLYCDSKDKCENCSLRKLVYENEIEE